MAATSVTGVGLGSADKRQKGSEHMRLGAEKIIGPRVVYAGRHTLDGSGDLTIELPLLPGVATDYIVTASDANAAAAAACAASLTLSGGATNITVKGPTSSAVFVMVVKAGLAI